jgi:hypothetical protein
MKPCRFTVKRMFFVILSSFRLTYSLCVTPMREAVVIILNIFVHTRIFVLLKGNACI